MIHGTLEERRKGGERRTRTRRRTRRTRRKRESKKVQKAAIFTHSITSQIPLRHHITSRRARRFDPLGKVDSRNWIHVERHSSRYFCKTMRARLLLRPQHIPAGFACPLRACDVHDAHVGINGGCRQRRKGAPANAACHVFC